MKWKIAEINRNAASFSLVGPDFVQGVRIVRRVIYMVSVALQWIKWTLKWRHSCCCCLCIDIYLLHLCSSPIRENGLCWSAKWVHAMCTSPYARSPMRKNIPFGVASRENVFRDRQCVLRMLIMYKMNICTIHIYVCFNLNWFQHKIYI